MEATKEKSPSFALVVIAHGPVERLGRLLTILSNYTPYIVCHYSGTSRHLKMLDLQFKDVVFLRRRFPVRWGHVSIVDAMVRSLRIARSSFSEACWFVITSGQDIPIIDPKAMAQYYKDIDASAVLASTDICRSSSPFALECRFRYSRDTFWLGRFAPWKRSAKTIRLSLLRRMVPAIDFEIYAGPAWCSLRRDVVELLEHRPTVAVIRNRLKWSFAADEAFFHTLVRNTRLLVCDQDLHYVRWVGRGKPAVLVESDKALWRRSDAHFARKVDLPESESLLRDVEQMVGID